MALLTRARTTLGDEELDAIAQQVVEGVLDPYGAADVLVAAVCEA